MLTVMINSISKLSNKEMLCVFMLTHQVALSKSNSESGGVTKLITQDLCPGEGGTLELGDSVEIKFTSWLVTDCALGAVSCLLDNGRYCIAYNVYVV